ncbi:MAG: hypothetical protein KA216_10885 [Giesbergeria sp.]|nr:hypothetical protein [Giesbergeria sp.]
MKRHALTILVALNVALTMVLAALWLKPDGSVRNIHWAEPAPLTNDYLQMLPTLPARQQVDTNRFLALLERPLFQLSRRPPPPPPPSAPEVAPVVDTLSAAQLSGVVVGDGAASAIITIAGKGRRVRLNESVDGWTLQSIQGRSVTFASGGQTRVLQLPRAAVANFSGAALPVALPAPPAPAPPPEQSATPVMPSGNAAATAATAATAADTSAAPPRRSRFSSGPQ